MPPETETITSTPTPNPPSPITETPEPAATEKSGGGPKVISLPTNALARIKADARERGRKAAAQESDKRAQALGFKDSAHMMTQLEQQKARGKMRAQAPVADRDDEEVDPDLEEPAAPQARPGANGNGKQNQSRQPNSQAQQQHLRLMSKLEKEKAQLLVDRKRLAKKGQLELKRNRRLQRQLDANEAEGQLRLAAVRAGVQDVDYALHCVKREMTGKSAVDLEKFDENLYFATTLRKSHPYLYAVEVQPATTGNGGAPAPKTPLEKPPTDTGAPVDARKLSAAEYEAHLKKRGLSRPLFGVVG
jgi:hypothetical protein